MAIIEEILANKNFEHMTNQSLLQNEFSSIYATDLISMVIKHGDKSPILMTQITADATLAVAVMLSLPAIILTENKVLNNDLINRANDEGIAIIKTPLTSVEAISLLTRMNIL